MRHQPSRPTGTRATTRTAPPRMHGGSRPRQGRLLVECCVALVLLAGAQVVLTATARAIDRLIDEARLHDVALREERSRVALLLGAPCAQGAAEGTYAVHPRITQQVVQAVTWYAAASAASAAAGDSLVAPTGSDTLAGSLHTLDLRTAWRRAPRDGAGDVPRAAVGTRTVSTGGWCE